MVLHISWLILLKVIVVLFQSVNIITSYLWVFMCLHNFICVCGYVLRPFVLWFPTTFSSSYLIDSSLVCSIAWSLTTSKSSLLSNNSSERSIRWFSLVPDQFSSSTTSPLALFPSSFAPRFFSRLIIFRLLHILHL